MEQVTELWLVLRQQLYELNGQLHLIPFDYLLLIAGLACLAALVLLISRVRAGRRLRRMRNERDTLEEQLATSRATYDSEVRWRRATEATAGPKVVNTMGQPKGP